MERYAYYNEIDPAAAHVLECLVKDGVIADGVVDRRSIADVEPKDVTGFRQAHFFAGGGLWSVAARMAGWPDDKELWTGSAPCQPFSEAGRKTGVSDERHLWPEFYRLIRACRPSCVVGEQTSAPLGRAWFDQVADDMEREDYTVRAADISPIAIGGSQIRQRLWFVACTDRFSPPRPTESRRQLLHWSPEPDMGCMAHEYPRRMDLLRICGNAISPKVGAIVLEALMESLS
jgi:DNA (cytosine-5)-methyltransferase 1